ncbi:hypothetical protein QBC44DRAFT_156944 [Cladorrhinum sp. PSN332]|nr:hypothetical protein QBC44DRAFT_156944 [Cladorrhinum sp. PSN332]
MDHQTITIADILLTKSLDPHFPGLHAMLSSYQSFLRCLLPQIGLSGTFSSDQFDKALENHGCNAQDVVGAMTGIQSAITQMCWRTEVLDDSDSLWTWKCHFESTWQGSGVRKHPIPSIVATVCGRPVGPEIKVLATNIALEALAARRCDVARCMDRLKACVPGSIGKELDDPLGGLINDFPDLMFWNLSCDFTRCPGTCLERRLWVYKWDRVLKRELTPPEGRLSGIAKLTLKFGGIRAYRGTGWLLDHNTIVTSGHNVVFNGKAERGEGKHLVSVKVTVGEPPHERTLMGVAVVVSWAWYHMAVGTQDLALIRVQGSFDATPLSWSTTPKSSGVSGDLELAGFPGDEDEMWHSGCDLNTNLTCPESSKQVVLHRGETLKGNSGSPIIRKADDRVIAVHRGGFNNSFNEGVILDDGSNNLSGYRRILNHAVSAGAMPNSDVCQVSSSGI